MSPAVSEAKSTAPPQYRPRVAELLYQQASAGDHIKAAPNPEFLRESFAV
ncbi:hypothetical protein ACH4OH_29735 [Streptomyces albidoflavus]